MFDSSLALVEAAAQGAGVALVPVAMFGRDIAAGRVVQPLKIVAPTGSYWLTNLKSRSETASMKTFRNWLLAELQHEQPASRRSRFFKHAPSPQ